jgi:hypothetical protein
MAMVCQVEPLPFVMLKIWSFDVMAWENELRWNPKNRKKMKNLLIDFMGLGLCAIKVYKQNGIEQLF